MAPPALNLAASTPNPPEMDPPRPDPPGSDRAPPSSPPEGRPARPAAPPPPVLARVCTRTTLVPLARRKGQRPNSPTHPPHLPRRLPAPIQAHQPLPANRPAPRLVVVVPPAMCGALASSRPRAPGAPPYSTLGESRRPRPRWDLGHISSRLHPSDSAAPPPRLLLVKALAAPLHVPPGHQHCAALNQRFLLDEGQSPREDHSDGLKGIKSEASRDMINMSMTNMPTETRVVSDIFG